MSMNREMRRLAEREERRNRQKQKRVPAQRGGTKQVERTTLLFRLLEFLREVRLELRRVSWPTREQMVVFTVVTIITSTALTLYVFALDIVFRDAVLTLLEAGS